jgi:hypothetical protein
VNEGVNFTPRGQISPLGDKFTPRGEIRPWGPGVKLRMALRPACIFSYPRRKLIVFFNQSMYIIPIICNACRCILTVSVSSQSLSFYKPDQTFSYIITLIKCRRPFFGAYVQKNATVSVWIVVSLSRGHSIQSWYQPKVQYYIPGVDVMITIFGEKIGVFLKY